MIKIKEFLFLSTMSMISQLQTALGLPWLGALIGLAGLLVGVVGIVLYLRSKTAPRPLYRVQSLRLIGEVDQSLSHDVEIMFRGARVARLTRTLITLWNGGNAILRGSDVVEDDPVRFCFRDGDEILQARILKVTRPANKIAVEVSALSDAAICRFDYLDPQDGGVIELLHTSQTRSPDFLGTIRAVPHGFTATKAASPESRRAAALFVSVAFVQAVLLGSIAFRRQTDTLAEAIIFLGLALFTAILFLASARSWWASRLYPKFLEIDNRQIQVLQPGPFEILEATYGTVEFHVNLTALLNEAIENDQLRILASNKIAGDPHPGVKKELKIKYTHNNQISTAAFKEGARVVLP